MVNKVSDCIGSFSLLKIGPASQDHVTALFSAVEQGNLPEVKRLLSLGINPNIQNTNGSTLLEKALAHVTISYDPLHAITAKAYSIIQLLITAGASCTHPIEKSWNIFDYAFSTHQFGLLVALHEYYHSQIPIRKESLEHFLLYGYTRKNGRFICKYYPCIEQQIINQAMQPGPHGGTWIQLLDRLLESYQPPYVPHPSLLISSPEMTKKFLDGGVKCHVQDEKGYTALHYIAQDIGNFGCLSLLLSQGADLFLPAKDGQTPLTIASQLACQNKNSAFLNVLQGDVASRKVPRPSLHEAILAGDLARQEKELGDGFDFETRDIFGNTAFQIAIRSRSLPAVQLFSDKYANKVCVNYEDLYLAARCSSIEIVSFLIKLVAVNQEVICAMLEEAAFQKDTIITQWIVEQYALLFPVVLLDEEIFSKIKIPFSLLETCVQKIAESPDLHSIIGELLLSALHAKLPQEATLLLDYLSDLSFFVQSGQVVEFYEYLFKYTDEEFVEKALKKFGISDKFCGGDIVVFFYKNCPRLFGQFSHGLFESLFERCKKKDLSIYSVRSLAVCMGEVDIVKRVLQEVTQGVIKTEIYKMLVLSLEFENETITKMLVQAYKEQQETIDFKQIYNTIIIPTSQEKSSQEKCKETLVRTIKLQRTVQQEWEKQEWEQQEYEEIAELLIAIKEHPHALESIIECIENTSSCSAIKQRYHQLRTFLEKISELCLLPCGRYLTSEATADWLVGKIFSLAVCQNPKLFCDDAILDTICDFLTRMRSPEEYGDLLEALQHAPNSKALVNQGPNQELVSPITDSSYRATILRPRIEEVRDAQGKTELFRAAELGNFSEVKRLLSFGASVHSKDANGMSVLEAALKPFLMGNMVPPYAETSKIYSLIQLLLHYGADFRQPLFSAIYNNIFDFVFSLQNYGLLFALHRYYIPEILIKQCHLDSFFTQCRVQDLEFILKYYPKVNPQFAPKQYTICHTFILHLRLDLLKKYQELAPYQFIQYVNPKFNPVDVPSLLVTALSLTTEHRWEIVNFLRANGAPFEGDPGLLMITPEITKSFLDVGMDPNEQNVVGHSALHLLAKGGGNIGCLQLLLERGASLFLPAHDGSTPYSIASDVKNGLFFEIAVKSELMKMATALHTAIFDKSLPAVQQLSESVSPVNLIFAAKYSSIEVVSFLIKQVALVPFPVNCYNDFQRERALDSTTMREMIAVSVENNIEVARWLVEHYAAQYPEVLGRYLVSKTCGTSSLACIQEYVTEIKKLPKPNFSIEFLFEEAMCTGQLEVASLLLDHLDDTEYYHRAWETSYNLFKFCPTPFVEKVLKKWGMSKEFFRDRVLVELFYKNHPALFAQASTELYEKGFLLCQKDPCFMVVTATMTLAIYTGNVHFVGQCYVTFAYQVVAGTAMGCRPFLITAIETGCLEVVAYLAEKIPLVFPDGLILCLKKGNDATVKALIQIYKKQNITIQLQKIYERIFQEPSPEVQKYMLIRLAKLLKRALTEQEIEESISLIMQIKEFQAAVAVFTNLICRESPFSELKKRFHAIAKFVDRLPKLCQVPCGHLSLHKTCDWLIEQTFFHCMDFNPKLFSNESVFDAILDLIPLVSKNEEYGALFVALQVAPDIETVHLAFRAAKRFEEVSKGSFIRKSEEEQKQWLAYACVYRDRSFLPLCYYLLKNHEANPEILFDALRAIHQIGVSRYNSDLENTLATELEKVLRKPQNEKVKTQALKAYVSMGQVSLDFLLERLVEARVMQASGYEAAVCSHLGKDYEWVSEVECEKAVLCLLSGVESVHEEVRFQTALALASIPHAQGLLAALKVVQGPTWDRMRPHFGKNQKDVTGPYWVFRSRPENIHDNQSAVAERILIQLVESSTLQNEESQIQREIDFRSIPNSTRYISQPIAYPPQADLIRGISTRKGGTKFREAVRDLFRKGAGSSQLTDYDTSACSGTWNKIGHMFASHNKDLFFKNSPYFSSDATAVVSESALIIFPARYYHKEYLRGEARLEKEGTLNNVLYRGIPHRWIKAVYLPIRFKADIELLTKETSLEKCEKGFTSDLFRGDSVKELKAFQRLLLAPEMDLSQVHANLKAFVEKIRYFPEVGVQEIEKILQNDGIQFVTEEEIKKETAKLGVKMNQLKTSLAIFTQ